MIDKINFMETLRSVAELTRTSSLPMTREEVMSYFKDMDLSKEQQEMVYQYILQPHDEEEDVADATQDTESTEEETVVNEGGESHLFAMYKEDVSQLPEVSKEEEEELYTLLSMGDDKAVQALADLWLPQVLTIVEDYSKHAVNVEDLVQEGNIGLLDALSHLLGDREVLDAAGYIRESIQKAMEDFIDEMMDEDDWESTVVAKATLVHEANKALATELGREPNAQELSDYTKMSLEEITDILELSNEDNKEKN